MHGGITYADSCNENALICHVPQPGEADEVHWFGFDFAHGGDYAPKMNADLRTAVPDSFTARHPPYDHERAVAQRMQDRSVLWSADVYATEAVARREVERLAEQLAAVRPKNG